MSLMMEEAVFEAEKFYEIVNGQLEEKDMAGARHGGVGMRLGARLVLHAEAHRLGEVYGVDTTFKIGANERIPDLAFVTAARLPDREPSGSWQMAPDLAVEIVSPTDIYEKVVIKAQEYLAAGVKQVWVISPEAKYIAIYRSMKDIAIFLEDEILECEDLLPGFRCPLREIFRAPLHA